MEACQGHLPRPLQSVEGKLQASSKHGNGGMGPGCKHVHKPCSWLAVDGSWPGAEAASQAMCDKGSQAVEFETIVHQGCRPAWLKVSRHIALWFWNVFFVGRGVQ